MKITRKGRCDGWSPLGQEQILYQLPHTRCLSYGIIGEEQAFMYVSFAQIKRKLVGRSITQPTCLPFQDTYLSQLFLSDLQDDHLLMDQNDHHLGLSTTSSCTSFHSSGTVVVVHVMWSRDLSLSSFMRGSLPLHPEPLYLSTLPLLPKLPAHEQNSGHIIRMPLSLNERCSRLPSQDSSSQVLSFPHRQCTYVSRLLPHVTVTAAQRAVCQRCSNHHMSLLHLKADRQVHGGGL